MCSCSKCKLYFILKVYTSHKKIENYRQGFGVLTFYSAFFSKHGVITVIEGNLKSVQSLLV